MRELKFRAKRLDNQQWVYGGISIFEGEATIFDENDMTNSAYEVDINTVGECIGIQDSKGIYLFENDSVMCLQSVKYTIQYNEEFCAFFLYPIESADNFMAIYPGIVLFKI